ncbi:ABC transporter ATP-binding protein [Marinobacter sp. CHS3-4]|uniref:ABC transporter ATP-binding protein n=1 Tax=Marinobacter sp. CHS3-4 TaxID=3045174 RepID=UPI0024B52AC3|nr:ABC transporter ATP-binding protein [Marinobacter sp. CHS3-4]MDI9244970.1 ABC transporter ATP-binding protein [Marinobacter sp. CHS3-4]
MIANLKELYSLLTDEQRKKLFRLQVLVLLMALAELASVISIGPFMAVVGDMDQLQGDGTLAKVYEASGIQTPEKFLFWMGIGVLGVLVASALLSMYTIWRLSMYGARVGAELGNRLYHYYLHQPWLFHASGSSSHLTSKIAQEAGRVTTQMISPLMQMNARIFMALMITGAMFAYNPRVAIAGFGIFVVAYWLMYKLVRRRLTRKGRMISSAQGQRFRLMSEGFGGVKDVLLLGRQALFTERFGEVSRQYADAQGKMTVMAQMPRYVMELIAFGSLIFLVLYLLGSQQGNLGAILPLLSVYALAGLKLLPAFQQIYSSVSMIRGSAPAFEAIREELKASSEDKQVSDTSHPNSRLHLTQSLQLQDVEFTYPGKTISALKGINIDIKANQVVGIVGASGSGKSTAIDILLGLIQPQKGELLVDGVPINETRRRAWQNSIGFVPQAIFLSDRSIRENIAFGIPKPDIDETQVNRAASMAHLDELLKDLPDGLDTLVGERGVQLSGGQRQRIGIARALYDDADVLILDEATSALDGITEKLIMDAIHDFAGKKTIIMIAHRLATVQKCDVIFLLEDGSVIDKGSYYELSERNEKFKRMAELS